MPVKEEENEETVITSYRTKCISWLCHYVHSLCFLWV